MHMIFTRVSTLRRNNGWPNIGYCQKITTSNFSIQPIMYRAACSTCSNIFVNIMLSCIRNKAIKKFQISNRHMRMAPIQRTSPLLYNHCSCKIVNTQAKIATVFDWILCERVCYCETNKNGQTAFKVPSINLFSRKCSMHSIILPDLHSVYNWKLANSILIQIFFISWLSGKLNSFWSWDDAEFRSTQEHKCGKNPKYCNLRYHNEK